MSTYPSGHEMEYPEPHMEPPKKSRRPKYFNQGMAIIQARKHMELCQRDFAKLAGINPTRMHTLEAGKNLMDIDELVKLRAISHFFDDETLLRMVKEEK